MKIRFLVGFLCAAFFSSGLAAGGVAIPELTSATRLDVTPELINRLAERIRTNHPAVLAAKGRVEAADAGVRAVRAWEDPMLKLGGMFADETMRAEDGDLIYGVEQRLPLFGKVQATRRVAEAERETSLAGVEYRFQMLRRDLAKALMRVALAERVVEVGGQDLTWLESMVVSLESRYAAGAAGLVEVLQVQNERARRLEQLRTDRRRQDQERFAVNRLLGRDLQAPWPELRLPEVAGPVSYSPRLADLAVRYEPRGRILRQEIQTVEAAKEQARRRRAPDVALGVQGRNYTGTGSFRSAEVMVSVNLPWGNAGRYRSDIDREAARLKSAELDLFDYEQAIREEVHGLTVSLDASRREALLYRDQILSRAETALESARAAWEAGGGVAMFREILEARRQVLEARLMHARAVAEQYQTLAELVLCCGLGDLEALQMIGAQPADASAVKP